MKRITALAGGVGAARLLTGLVPVVAADHLTIIVNTGDDFEWLGLYICPDLDTVMYTLAGLANPETGWGMQGDMFQCLERLATLGINTWFRLGDRDLATHIYRSHELRMGRSLTEVTAALCEHNGVRAHILPMTGSPVPTQVHTDHGILGLQDYFVRRRCTPHVTGFSFLGIEKCTPAPGVIESLHEADAVIVCPSNPFISIGPILSVPGIRSALRESQAVLLAVSPVIAGRAIKGPTALMLEQLGMEVSALSIASMYKDFLDLLVLDDEDASLVPRITALGIQARTTRILMDTPESKVELARRLMEMLG